MSSLDIELAGGLSSRYSRLQRHAGRLLRLPRSGHLRSSRAGRSVRGAAGDAEEVDNKSEDDAKPHSDDSGHDLFTSIAYVAGTASVILFTWIASKRRSNPTSYKSNQEETVQVLSESFSAAIKQGLSSGTLTLDKFEAISDPQEGDHATACSRTAPAIPQVQVLSESLSAMKQELSFGSLTHDKFEVFIDPQEGDHATNWIPTYDEALEFKHGKASRWDVWEELLQTEGTKRLPKELRKIFRCDTYGNVVMWSAEQDSPFFLDNSCKITKKPKRGPPCETPDALCNRLALYYGAGRFVKENMPVDHLTEEQKVNMACGIQVEQTLETLRTLAAACQGLPVVLQRKIWASVFSRLAKSKNRSGKKGWDTRKFDWNTQFDTIVVDSILNPEHCSELEGVQAITDDRSSWVAVSDQYGVTDDDEVASMKKTGELNTECMLETLGAYSVAVLVNIKKRNHEAAEAFGVAHGRGPGEANGSNLKNLARYVREEVAELTATTAPKGSHVWQLMREGELVGIYMYSCSLVNYGMLIAEHEGGSHHIRDIVNASKGAAKSGKWRERLQASLAWICVHDVPAEVATRLPSWK